ncbi:hypothetical protein [Metapseudomonas boanensis]|uniref:Type 1 fimbrial protein n=1 Tax=Metapseudomonas boanensis TaxID=2822138 RepID=A0ABS5XNN1_9GAMM|nr:hypothetical protein [Pseudomonas boanensis]MBT8769306.1 hypothetical protein [Pseudomonas boanensis]
MKRLLLVAVIASGASPTVLYADEPKIFHGVIHFVGSIVRGPCEVAPAAWLQHAGRDQGRSPHQAAVPAVEGNCAGVPDTHSISFTPVRNTRTGAFDAGTITVVFN